MGLLKKVWILTLLKRSMDYCGDGGNQNIQIIQGKVGQGSREHDLLGELVITLVT